MRNNKIVPGFDDEKEDSHKIRLKKVKGVEGCLVLYFTGHLDIYNSNNFQRPVFKAIQVGFIKLIFDIAGTNFHKHLAESNEREIRTFMKGRRIDVWGMNEDTVHQ